MADLLLSWLPRMGILTLSAATSTLARTMSPLSGVTPEWDSHFEWGDLSGVPVLSPENALLCRVTEQHLEFLDLGGPRPPSIPSQSIFRALFPKAPPTTSGVVGGLFSPGILAFTSPVPTCKGRALRTMREDRPHGTGTSLKWDGRASYRKVF